MLHDIFYGVAMILSVLLATGVLSSGKLAGVTGIALLIVITIIAVSYDHELHKERMRSIEEKLHYAKLALEAYKCIEKIYTRIKQYQDYELDAVQTIEEVKETVIEAERNIEDELKQKNQESNS